MFALNTYLSIVHWDGIWFDGIWFDGSCLKPFSWQEPSEDASQCPRAVTYTPSFFNTLHDGCLVLVIFLHLVCWFGLEYPEHFPFPDFLQCIYCLRKSECGNITQQKQKHRIHLHCIFFLSLSMCLVWCKPSASTILISQYLRFFHYCFRKPLQGFFQIHFWLSHV